MGRIDTRYAYSQARLQARYGARPSSADWSLVAATADLGALLQVLRGSSLGRWTARLGDRPHVHEIEQRLREQWLHDVDEVARWQPDPWRDGVRWLRWIVYLPALQKIARGGRPPIWMRVDPVLAPIVAREPRDRSSALQGTALAPLAVGFDEPADTAGAWTRRWRQLWPSRQAARRPLELLLGEATRTRTRLAELPATTRANETLKLLERRMELAFRRNPLSPAAAAAYLGLLALDMSRIRGALATRALQDDGAAP
ncbi:MAG: hypothetical protein MUO39_06680 [Steroidobacteraceae bacterium]|nr:hypothetical protein [Steroidobacteraceae bacterium]